MMIHILFGSPGAGKGTHGRTLAMHLGATVVSTGDLFRHEIAQGSALGKRVAPFQSSGALVPDEIADPFIFGYLDTLTEGVLLDGYPRSLAQADTLFTWMRDRGHSVGQIINLTASPEVIVARIASRRICVTCSQTYNTTNRAPLFAGYCDLCGGYVVQRPDDAPVVTRRRLQLFQEVTAPVLEAFLDHGMTIRTIDTENISEEGILAY